MDRLELYNRISRSLASVHGRRFHGVVVFGSEANGTSKEDSDVDLLVLLEGPIELWKDTRTSVAAVYDIQLEMGRPIHPIPVDKDTYDSGKCALYRTAKKEGIAV